MARADWRDVPRRISADGLVDRRDATCSSNVLRQDTGMDLWVLPLFGDRGTGAVFDSDAGRRRTGTIFS